MRARGEEMLDGDNDAFVRNQVLDGDLAFVRNDVRHAWRGVLGPNLKKLSLDDGHDARFLRQNVEEVFDLLDQLHVFFADLVDFQPRQTIEL
jgi:hypothetical protein